MKKQTAKQFNYDQDFDKTDFRKHPELYSVGKGEQGVLLVEPYKSEILPHWRFKTPEIATESSEKIYALFLEYLQQDDFIGADMARKYLQMGYTRARRYANHKSGKKYDGPVPDDKKGQSGAHGRDQLPQDPDPVKAKSAEIFKKKWDQAKNNETYLQLMENFKAKYR
ncbi:DUF4385 domain-containing protein [uncultured Pontibacter sp.]|uniref:DUF4385 domain-containing protein n=1 Tax=uncultured Pontibacter sp. TaxID=453356 RepID=UPI00262D38BB|nr:DUF4385 domain-containing protein [uncultured Pontibacter sp.]